MKKLREARRVGLAGLLLAAMVGSMTGCGSGGSGGGGTQAGGAATGTVTGQVVSAAAGNAPVAGATVSTTAGSTTTANDGSFTVLAPANDRAVLHVQATGFAETFPVTRVVSGQTTTIGVKLLPVGATATVNVATGDTVTVPNSTAQVVLPPNGLVPKTGGQAAGSVTVSVTPINPAADPNLMPGDFTGVSAGGTTPIESFGALVVDIRDNAGTRYNLAAGKTSTIRIPLGTQNPNPPATVPLWFFDETTGLWKEEGTATLQGAAPDQYYEGTVTHFSTWNADQPLQTTLVKGCVRDANGQPVPNAMVVSQGIDYTGSDIQFTSTDGTFQVGVRKGSSASISVREWSLNPFDLKTISNAVTSSPTDPADFVRTLPNCLVVNPGVLTITTQALPGGNVGTAYNHILGASGGVPAYVWSLDATSNPLPAGLSLDSGGVISGTPTVAGTTVITVKVTDSVNGTATKQLSLTVNPPGVVPIAITTTALPRGTVGSVYSVTVTATGGTGTKMWSVVSGALPDGLTLDPSTGTISGTPTTAGTSTFTIRVQDSASPPLSDQRQLNLTINPTGGGGGGGTLTVSGAPESVGGTFVPDGLPIPVTLPPNNNTATVTWLESAPTQQEVVFLEFDVTTNLPVDGYFALSLNNGQVTAWICTDPVGTCGVTVNRSAGTVTFTNTVLEDASAQKPPITLNGTLTFQPL